MPDFWIFANKSDIWQFCFLKKIGSAQSAEKLESALIKALEMSCHVMTLTFEISQSWTYKHECH